jgi:hypothetical protein
MTEREDKFWDNIRAWAIDTIYPVDVDIYHKFILLIAHIIDPDIQETRTKIQGLISQYQTTRNIEQFSTTVSMMITECLK